MSTVLVVDDKEMMRDSVGATLQRAGMGVLAAVDGNAAIELVARRRPDAVVTDLRMPGMTGIELLEKIREIDEDLPVILMTAFGAVETAVQAIKLGAFDYLTKPFEGDELVVAVKRAIEHGRLVRENALLRRDREGDAGVGDGAGPRGLDRLVGTSAAMRRVREQVMAVAESAGTVLVYGESGTGKEVVARAIHDLSPRQNEAFLAVNCAALSESLLESELFGHERGSFTGAEKLRKGRFELSDRGTLLLDEISEVSTRVQAKLLRVLQERSFERVGASVSIGVDVRVIATSNRDLPKAVARGEFRQDLFFRLNVLPIHLPPLRDRVEDVPAIAEHFLGIIAQREARPGRRFDDEAMAVLMAYAWPGNVRELQNICERAAVLSKSEVIGRELVEPWLPASGGALPSVPVTPHVMSPSSAPSAPPTVSFPSLTPTFAAHSRGSVILEAKAAAETTTVGAGSDPGLITVLGRPLEEIEREAIVMTLHQYRGHRQRAAQSLGIGVRTLGLKLKKWKEEKLVEPTL